MGSRIRNALRAASLTLPLAAMAIAFGPAAYAQSTGGGEFLPDRVAEVLMQQASAANMAACEGVLTPTGQDGTYRLIYRVVRPGGTMIPRPASSMTAIVLTDACRR